MAMVDIDELMTVRRAADTLGLTREWLRQLIRQGRLKVVNIDGVRFVRKSELERWQTKREAEKAAAQAVAA